MIRITSKTRLLSLTAALCLLAVGQANAQAPYYGPATYGAPGYIGMGPASFGLYTPGIPTPYAFSPTSGWTGYGIDITGWGSGYGTGWGFGYVNPYAGSGYGLSAYGESPYSLAMARAQQSALLASRFNLMNAQTAQAYQAANLYRQQALGIAAEMYRQNKLYQPYYGVATGRPGVARRRGTVAVIPRDRLIDASGKVLWPASTPSGAKLNAARQEADDAIAKVFQEQKENGRASVRSVVAAREKLAAFAGTALERLRADSPADAAGLEVFLYSLDRALVAMANNAATGPGRINVTPDDAPKTGGEVLKEGIEKDRERGTAATPKNPSPR